MNISKIMSNVSMFLMCISGVLLYQCTASPDASSGFNYYNDRQEVTRELITLRNDIDRNIEKVQRVGTTTKESRDRRERAVGTLIKKKNQVEEMLGRVNNATQDDWSTISKNARATLSDVKRVCKKLEKNEIAIK